jgi:hypothetical protein
MATVNIINTLGKKSGVLRESAYCLREAVASAASQSGEELILDFEGMQWSSLSFLQGIFIVLQEVLSTHEGHKVKRVVFKRIQKELSPGYAAIGRAYSKAIAQTAPDDWTVFWQPHDEGQMNVDN